MNFLMFLYSLKMVVQEQCVLWLSLTGDALEKDNVFSVPEQCLNSHSRTMRYEDFINRLCIKTSVVYTHAQIKRNWLWKLISPLSLSQSY